MCTGLEPLAFASLFGAAEVGTAGAALGGATAASGAAGAGAGLGATAGAVAGLGGVLGAAGTGLQAYGTYAGSQASRAAEEARKQQMLLESSRKQRDVIKQAIVARSVSTDRTTAQGASFGSALPGALGEATSQESTGLNDIGRATDIGNRIFDANAQYANAQAIGGYGKGFSTLGGSLINNNVPIAKVGLTLFGGNKRQANPYNGDLGE